MSTVFFTGKGDDGVSKVGKIEKKKSDALFCALGGLDELNSWIGLCAVEAKRVFDESERERGVDNLIDVHRELREFQEGLFVSQAEVAAIGFGTLIENLKIKVGEERTKDLERVIGIVSENIPEIKKFIIPGGSELAGRLDVARTIVRRVERDIVKAMQDLSVRPEFLKFINRSSTFLFALSRYVNFRLGVKEENPRY